MSEERNDIPMVPKHQSEMEKMHLTHQNSSMKNLCIVVAVLMTIAVVAVSIAAVKITVKITNATVEQSRVFVDNYTARTEKWLETFVRMHGGSPEVLNEKTETGIIQQPSVP